MAEKLTILFAPTDAVGHVNSCIGLGECLRDRGHKIVFVIDQTWEGKLTSYGFTEEIIENEDLKCMKPGENGANILLKTGLLSWISPKEKIEIMSKRDQKVMVDTSLRNEPKLKSIIDRQRPDIYIIDNFIGSPTLIYSDKPWVLLFSGNPLFVINDERTPPKCSGN